jgi:hypothetical protein
MLRELERRRFCLRWQIENQPWFAWARSLSERHGRLTERRGALDLVLARLPLPKLFHESWLLSSQRFYPQINLTIHPILRQAVWNRETALLPDSRTTVAKFVASYSSIIRQFWNQMAFLRHVAIPDDNSHQTFNDASSSTVEKEKLLLQSPLQLVFQRLFHTGESVHLQNKEIIQLQRSQITTETNNNRTLFERIARLSERIEERAAETTTLVIQRRPAIEMAPRMTPNPRIFGKEVEQPGQQNAASAAAIDISQITDQVVRQIDRRVVATRERLGKI